MKNTRNKKTGRYSFHGDWDRVCVCGRTLGDHAAEAPHDLDDTGCGGFKPVRTAGGAP